MTDGIRRMPPLLDRISFLIYRINAHLLRHLNPKLKVWGIELTESRLLVTLLELGPLAAGDLVRIMALPQSTVSHQVKRLEKLGYVVRRADTKDSRVIIASLSTRGAEIARQANEESRWVTERLDYAIGDEEEIEMVRSAMKRVDQLFGLGV